MNQIWFSRAANGNTVTRNALSPILLKLIVLLHVTQNALCKSPLTCLTHVHSVFDNQDNQWVLKQHFPGIICCGKSSDQAQTRKYMWHAQKDEKLPTQQLVNDLPFPPILNWQVIWFGTLLLWRGRQGFTTKMQNARSERLCLLIKPILLWRSRVVAVAVLVALAPYRS